MIVLKPRQPVPALDVETLQGQWSLAEQAPKTLPWSFFIVVYTARCALNT